jgi:hypothetical protein
MRRETLPKYKNAPREVLHSRIAELEARVITLKEELEKVRAQQIDELDVFLNAPRDLRTMFARYTAMGDATADRLNHPGAVKGKRTDDR